MKENLKSLRNLIDRIDEEIFHLLKKRVHYAKKIARHKKNPYDPFREREVLEKMRKRKVGPVFREIISLCRGEEGGFRVFIPDGEFYPFILKKFFGESIEYALLEKEEDCLENVKRGKGVAFLEAKRENLLKLKKKNLKIVWLGSMKIGERKTRFFLIGREPNQEISRFPSNVMLWEKKENEILFSEIKIEKPEELKKLKDESILGIYPVEEERD